MVTAQCRSGKRVKQEGGRADGPSYCPTSRIALSCGAIRSHTVLLTCFLLCSLGRNGERPSPVLLPTAKKSGPAEFPQVDGVGCPRDALPGPTSEELASVVAAEIVGYAGLAERATAPLFGEQRAASASFSCPGHHKRKCKAACSADGKTSLPRHTLARSLGRLKRSPSAPKLESSFQSRIRNGNSLFYSAIKSKQMPAASLQSRAAAKGRPIRAKVDRNRILRALEESPLCTKRGW